MSYRKMRKQVTGSFNPHNFDLEIGDRVYSSIEKKVYDLYESTGLQKAASGELSYREPLAQINGALPVLINNIWYWRYE